MNGNHLQCDDRELERLLVAGEHTVEHNPWMQHVEHCSHCQARLRELAADDEDWKAAAAVLAADEEDAPCFAHDCETPASWNESMLRQLLRPPSHPEMLGRLGRYEMERAIGSGGMGIVFKAFDTDLNRVVAVKLLAPYLAARGSARKRFAREARAAAGVRDDHVVPIFNVESEHESPFLVMQYIAGGSLQEKLNRDGPLEVTEILRIGLQTAKGLAAAHAQGLIHRDVKPSNILLDEGVERALLTDFGLARAEDDACLTRSGFHPGTPHYMSPEQVRGEAIDGRSDLFSLGCVIYALCTGHSPFRADTSYAVMRRITDEQPRPIREVNAGVPEWLEAIAMKLLSKPRAERFESASEVAELLGGCLAHLQDPTSTPLPVAVGELAKSFEASMHASKPVDSLTGFRFLPGRKAIALASLAFFVLAGTIVYLKTGKGTLRIESNSEANVPIVIRKGGEIVDHLTVSMEGASRRLQAGEYVLQIDEADSDLIITGRQITLKRGQQWIARITESPRPFPVTGELNPPVEAPPTNDDLTGSPTSGALGGSRNDFSLRGDTAGAISSGDLHDDLRLARKTNQLRLHVRKEAEFEPLLLIEWDVDEGISWLFSGSPIRREKLGLFPYAFNLGPNQKSRVPMIDLEDRRIETRYTMECQDASDPFWESIRGKKIRIRVSREDFNLVVDGTSIRKVIYLPEHEGVYARGFDTLSSTRMDGDVLGVAKQRGQPVISVVIASLGDDAASTGSSTFRGSQTSPLLQRGDNRSESQDDIATRLATPPMRQAVSEDRKVLSVRLHGDKELALANPDKPESDPQPFAADGFALQFLLEKPGDEACFHIMDGAFTSVRAVVRLECSEFLPEESWGRLGDQSIELSISHDDFVSVLSGNLMDRVVYLPEKSVGDLLQTETSQGIGRPRDVAADAHKWGRQPFVSLRLDPPTAADKVAKSHQRMGPKFSSGRSNANYFRHCSNEELLAALQGEWTQTHLSFKGEPVDSADGKTRPIFIDGSTFRWHSVDVETREPSLIEMQLELNGPGVPRLFRLLGHEPVAHSMEGSLELTPDGQLTLRLAGEEPESSPHGGLLHGGALLINARRVPIELGHSDPEKY